MDGNWKFIIELEQFIRSKVDYVSIAFWKFLTRELTWSC